MKSGNRRRLSLLVINIIIYSVFSSNPSFGQSDILENNPSPIELSLNAYSFSDLLSSREKSNNQPVYTLFNLLDWCASQDIKAIDPTGYFFPGYPEVPSDEYIYKFKNRAAELGIAIERHRYPQ